MTLTAVSLFAGIAGIDLACERAGNSVAVPVIEWVARRIIAVETTEQVSP